jgi:4-amino-4-deoxy-L-arabinose transferase-like glycosyltransferase
VTGRLGRRLVLLGVVAVGLVLRGLGLRWGLPDYLFPDAAVHFLRPAVAAAAGGSLLPVEFVHPTVLFLLLGAALRLWAALSGAPVELGLGHLAAELARAELVGRVVVLACAGASIVLVHAVGRRVVGERAALFAAATYAVAPLPVLESHRVAPDVPMLLFTLLAWWVVLGADPPGAGRLLAGFALTGLATATKYTGAFAATVPAWRTVAGGTRRRLAVLAAGAVAGALGFLAGCVPCAIRHEAFLRSLRLVGRFGYVVGMAGVDLTGTWPQLRYAYPLVVALPFMMGWPLHLAAFAGLALLWRRDRQAAAVLLAAIVPYLLFMGGAISAVPRYYLFLSPALALAAAPALDRLWGSERLRPAGALLAGLAVAYTAALALSQVARLGLAPQREVGALVARLAAAAGDDGRTLVVAYPNRYALPYDAVRPFLRAAGAKITELPEAWGYPGADATAAPAEAPDAATWLRAHEVDVVVLPSWIEAAIRRGWPDGAASEFIDRLERGELGLRLAGDFRTHFLTEGLYTWGDPMLHTHWETAIAGYKVFVRDGAGAAS